MGSEKLSGFSRFIKPTNGGTRKMYLHPDTFHLSSNILSFVCNYFIILNIRVNGYKECWHFYCLEILLLPSKQSQLCADRWMVCLMSIWNSTNISCCSKVSFQMYFFESWKYSARLFASLPSHTPSVYSYFRLSYWDLYCLQNLYSLMY